MPRMKPKFRNFDGKRYQLEGSYDMKEKATRVFNQWKGRGWNARVVKGTGGNDKWRVYKRYNK